MSSEKSLGSDEDPFVEDDVDNEPQDGQAPRPSKRRANLYDAIAGRVNPRGVHAIRPVASQYRDTASSGARALRPEELLCRRQNLATQAIDEETYFAHEELPSDQPLPGSELLEAMHAYAADYFEYATADNGQDDHQTMDETALLAMGILIEEMAAEELGNTGDLVLVEGQGLSDAESEVGLEGDTATNPTARATRRKRVNSMRRSRLKRRKVTRSASVTTDVDTEIDDGRWTVGRS